MISTEDLRRYALNFAITLPSIFLIFYLSGYILANLSVPIIILVLLPFFVKHVISGRLKAHIYPISFIIFLLFLLGTIYYLATGVNLPIISLVKIPFTFTSLTSLTFGLGIVLVMEAVISDKFTYTIGEYTGSLLIFMQQLAVITVMLSPDFASITSQAGPALYSHYGISNPSAYESAYFTTISLEAYALYSLFVQGYQQYLPLAYASTPVDPVMIALFITSATGILLSLYVRDNHSTTSRLGMLGSYSVIGAMFAAIVLIIAQTLEYTSYQILVIGGSAAAVLFLVGYTSSRVPGNETINTSIK